MAASQTDTEIFYFRGILCDLGMYQGEPTPLNIDKTPVQKISHASSSHARARAASPGATSRSASLRPTESCADGIVRVARVATDNNPAGIMTKPLLKPAFIRHRDTLMLSE